MKEDIEKVKDYEALLKEREYTVFQLTSYIESKAKKLTAVQLELDQNKERQEELEQNIEDLKEKNQKLADHYEGKINLLEEEIIMIKKQRSAVLKGGILSNTLLDSVDLVFVSA